jgi:hypothetical protein
MIQLAECELPDIECVDCELYLKDCPFYIWGTEEEDCGE